MFRIDEDRLELSMRRDFRPLSVISFSDSGLRLCVNTVLDVPDFCLIARL